MKNKKVVSHFRAFVLARVKSEQQASGRRVYVRNVLKDIEHVTGVDWRNTNQMYKGLSNGSLEVAIKLSRYFDCSVEDLYTLE